MDFNSKVSKILALKKVLMESAVLETIKMSDIGFKPEDIYEQGFEIIEITDKDEFAEIDPNESFYYYDGPLDEKTRDFCKEILLTSKFFRQDDIDKLSTRAGYDVDLFFGSYNCRHTWKRARIKGQLKEGYVPPVVSGHDINKIGKLSILKNR